MSARSHVTSNFPNLTITIGRYQPWVFVDVQYMTISFSSIKTSSPAMFSANSAFQWLHADVKPKYMAPPFHAPFQKYAYPSPAASSEVNSSSLYNLLAPSFFSISSSFPFIQSSTSNPASASTTEATIKSSDNSSKNCFFDITVDSGKSSRYLNWGTFFKCTNIFQSPGWTHHVQAP